MKIIRYICNILFIVILVLFTIAYTTKPIIDVSSVVNIKFPLLPDGKQLATDINEGIKAFLYMDHLTTNNNSITNNANIEYKDINSTAETVSTIFTYLFIGVSICIGLVIVLSFVGLKFISYIPLSLSQLVMIIFTVFIIIVYNTNFLNDILTNYINNLAGLNVNIPGVDKPVKITLSNTSINYDTGGILITLSTALLFITHIMYSILG